MVAGTPDEWGDVFFYRMDPSILYDVEGSGVKDRNMALNITRNSSATIMGDVDLTDSVEVKINGTLYVNDESEGDGNAALGIANMPDTYSFGKVEVRRSGVFHMNFHAPLGMDFVVHKDASLYGEHDAMVLPVGNTEPVSVGYTRGAKFSMHSTPDKWHIYSFEKDEETQGEAAVILSDYKVPFEFVMEIGEGVTAYVADGKEVNVDGDQVWVKGTYVQTDRTDDLDPAFGITEGSGRLVGAGNVILMGNGKVQLDTGDWSSDPDSALVLVQKDD